MFDLQSLVKYVLEGAAVAAAAFYIPSRKSDLKEVLMIALTAAAVFAVLDNFAPNVGSGARQGAGFGIGYTMVGGEGDMDDVEGNGDGMEGGMDEPEDFVTSDDEM